MKVLYILGGLIFVIIIAAIGGDNEKTPENDQVVQEEEEIEKTESESKIESEADPKSKPEPKYIYHTKVADMLDYTKEATSVVNELIQIHPNYWGVEHLNMIDYQVRKMELVHQEAQNINPPRDNKDHYSLFINGLRKHNEAMVLVREGIKLKSSEKIIKAVDLLDESSALLSDSDKFLK